MGSLTSQTRLDIDEVYSMIAQELATLIPERIASLVLTSTTAGNTRQAAPVRCLCLSPLVLRTG